MARRLSNLGLKVLSALSICLLAAIWNPARAEPLVADLSDHLIAITTSFTGTELLLFGSIEEEGEVIVVVYGPRRDVTVRRKDRTAGVWMNRDAMDFGGVPGFYHIAATPDAIAQLPQPVLERHQIGAGNLKLDLPAQVPGAEAAVFKEALIRNKHAEELYTLDPGSIEMRGQRLFRTSVVFPANVPIGTYLVETFLVRNGNVESAQTTPLFVSKLGAGAEIFRMANSYPAVYGVIAIIIAVVAGLGANWVFRKLG